MKVTELSKAVHWPFYQPIHIRDLAVGSPGRCGNSDIAMVWVILRPTSPEESFKQLLKGFKPSHLNQKEATAYIRDIECWNDVVPLTFTSLLIGPSNRSTSESSEEASTSSCLQS